RRHRGLSPFPTRRSSDLVENRVGATGAIAAEYVAKSPADGYTLFWATTPQVSIVPLIQKVNYDPLKDFAPVSIFGKNTYVLAVQDRKSTRLNSSHGSISY